MANIGELNFEVIVSDKQFDAKIKEIENKAKQFNTSLSNILNINKVSTQMSQAEVENARRVHQARVDSARAQERINREKIRTEGLQKRINAQIDKASKGYQSQGRILQELKGYALGYLSIHGATQLLSSLVRVTGEFELQKTTLAAMLGDLNKAEGVITRIQGLAVESPFQFKELTTYAKQLSAFSVPAQELYDTTKMLADISAGLGVGMDRIVLAYGQVRSAAFLRGQEVRQFTEAGIPILDELAKQFSELEGRAVSTGEVFDKISARLVPFEMVAKVFKDMTSEGGKFYNMQQVQAETLRGKLSNLKDAYEMMLNEIGKGQTENLKGAVDWVRKLMQNYEETGRSIMELVVAYGAYRAALVATSLVQAGMARNMVLLLNKTRALITTLAANPYAVLAAGVVTLGYALYKVGREQTTFEKSLKIANDTVEDANKNFNEEAAMLDYLFGRLGKLTVGTKEYNEVKSEILREHGQYLTDVEKEALEVGNLAVAYDKLRESILEANREKAMSEGSAKLTKLFTTEYDAIFDRFNTTINTLGIESKTVRTALSEFVRGKIGLEDLPEEALAALNEAKARVNAAAYTRGGMFGSGVNFLGFDFEVLRNDLKEVDDTITQMRSDLSDRLGVIYGPSVNLPDTSKLVEGWRKTVQDTLTGMGLDKGTSFGLWAEDTTQSTSYVEDMIKRYKELGEEIKWVSSFDKDQAERLKKNKDAIEAIAKALNIDIKNLAANDSDTWESKEERRIKRLIDTLRKLQDQYDELKELGVLDDSIKTLFRGWYPELGGEFFNDTDFLKRAKDAAEELKKIAPEDAEKILVSLGGDKYTQYVNTLKDQQKAYKESAKAAGEYFNTLRKWATEDFNLDGEGITLDVSKIASELSEKMNEIDLRARKAKETFGQIDVDSEEEVAKVKEIFTKEFGADAWTEFWKSYQEKGTDAIDALAAKQKESERKLAQERVNDLAKKYIEEAYFNDNIKLTDLADKNFFQIRTIRKELQDLLSKDPLKIPAEIEAQLKGKGIDSNNLVNVDLDNFFKGMADAKTPIGEADQAMIRLIQSIQKANLSTKDLSDTIKKIMRGDLKELTEEEAKALMTMVKSFMSEMDGLMSSISDYAESIGNEELQGSMNGISESMSILGSVADKLSQGDWVGAIISGVTKLASVAFEAASAQNELNAAIAETRNEMALLNSQKSLNEGVESVFGTDDFKKFQNAYDEAVKAHQDAIKDIERQNQTFWGRSKDNWGTAGVAGSLAAGAGLGAAVGSIFPVVGTAIGAGIGALVGMVTGLIGNAATEANDYATSLQQMADEIGVDLIDSTTGTFDVDALKNIKKTYKDLDKEYQDILDKLIANAEVYKNAITEMATYMTDIFGECANQMADAFIDSFKKSGEAALDYGDIMDSVATSIAKSMIKSAIIQNVWDDEKSKQAAAMLASGDAGGAMQIVDEAMRAAQELAPHIQELLKSLEPYLQMEEEKPENTLGSGIKGITEDTANLLASYLNAIRADVSYSKTIWERMDATTQRIAAALAGFSAPSLMEYQAQIAANTYNTALNTQEILSRLDSVITSSDGPTGIRVYS